MQFFAGVILTILIMIGIDTFDTENRGPYRQGQIDALSGKVLFELKQNSTGETVWVRKEEKQTENN